MAKRNPKAPVSERALIQRINRKLAEDDRILKISRSERMKREYGRYYILNSRLNVIQGLVDINLEAMAREVGALADWETLAETE